MVHSVTGWTRGVQVKLWDPLRTRAIPERLRVRGVFTTRRYTNPRLPLPLPLHLRVRITPSTWFWTHLRVSTIAEDARVLLWTEAPLQCLINLSYLLTSKCFTDFCAFFYNFLSKSFSIFIGVCIKTITATDTTWLRASGLPNQNSSLRPNPIDFKAKHRGRGSSLNLKNCDICIMILAWDEPRKGSDENRPSQKSKPLTDWQRKSSRRKYPVIT